MIELARLAEALSLDVASVRSLLATFLEASSRDLQDLERSLAAGDAESVAVTAHHIRGAAANLELQAIESAAARIESSARAGSLADLAAEVAAIRSGLASLRRLDLQPPRF